MSVHAAASVLILALLAVPVHAQTLTPHEQLAADVASYVTVGVNLALDTRASCWQAVDRKQGCLREAARLGTTWAVVALVKHFVPRDRPCAPSCGIDDPRADLPSGHTAFAMQAVDDPRRLFFAMGTGELRLLAHKHDLIGVLTGAGVGALTRFIR